MAESAAPASADVTTALAAGVPEYEPATAAVRTRAPSVRTRMSNLRVVLPHRAHSRLPAAGNHPGMVGWIVPTIPGWLQLRHPDGAEAGHPVGLDRGPADMAGVGAQVQRIHEEGAALEDLVGAGLGPLRVPPRRGRVVVAGVPVGGP